MNSYFWKIWLPLITAGAIGILLTTVNIITINVWLLLFTWFLIGPIGMGVGFHRLFTHRQFKTSKLIEFFLAVFGTFSAYAPLGISIASHQYHHKHSDSDVDSTSPTRGLFWSLVGYRLTSNISDELDFNNRPFKEFFRNYILVFLSKHFVFIIWIYVFILTLIDINLLFTIFIFPAIIEHTRLSVVGYLGHKNTLLSYQNHNTQDHSHNNYLLGILSCGLGWHNNHHADPGKLLLTEKYWEIDIEGIIGKLLETKK